MMPKSLLLLAFLLQRSDAELIALIPLGPPAYSADVNVAVHFAEPGRVTQLCGGAPEGKLLLGCATAKPPQMAVPNPCLFVDELYARLLCHEIQHVNGYPADHRVVK